MPKSVHGKPLVVDLCSGWGAFSQPFVDAGWKMPPDTVYVGRPTKWGNPWKIGDKTFLGRLLKREDVIEQYEDWLKIALTDNPHFLDELKGKDLVCWCPLDKPCHVDVILKLLEVEQ